MVYYNKNCILSDLSGWFRSKCSFLSNMLTAFFHTVHEAYFGQEVLPNHVVGIIRTTVVCGPCYISLGYPDKRYGR
jgi:hypothetical protein